jgi:hypothetical protein
MRRWEFRSAEYASSVVTTNSFDFGLITRVFRRSYANNLNRRAGTTQLFVWIQASDEYPG